MKERLLLTIISLLSYISALSQDSLQIKRMQKQTDTVSLNKFKKKMKREEKLQKELKCNSRKINTPYKGNIDGKEYQLKKIDKKKKIPIYYTTYGNENKNIKLKEPQQDINQYPPKPSNLEKAIKDSLKIEKQP